MRIIMLVVLLAFSSGLPAKKTLSQAVAGAWAISRGLDSQKLEAQSAAIAEQSALRQKRFAVFFNGGYRYTSDNVQVKASDFPFSMGPDVPAGRVLLSTPNDSIDLKLSLLQPIYAGGLLDSAVKMETARLAAELDLVRLRRLELAGRVKSSYFTHQMLSSRRDSLSAFMATLDRHLQKMKNLHAEELVRRSDLLEAQARADDVRLNLADLEQLLAAEAVQFSSLCGLDPCEVEYQPAWEIASFEEAREYFTARHPLLSSLDARQRLVQAQQRAIAAAYRPQVGLFAELHYGRPGQNYFVNHWTLYILGGLSVSMPVFSWNRRGRDLELADIAGRKLDNQRAEFIRESETALRQLYLSLASAGKKLALLESLVANASEEVGLKEKLYEESQIDHASLLAAMSAQERYESSRAELQAQLEMFKAGIDTLIGRCEEEE